MKKGITVIIGILVVMLAFGGMTYAENKSGQQGMQQQGQVQAQTQGKGQMQSQQMGLKKLNINTATAQELQRIPGMNQNLAQNIIDYRTVNGPYESIDDLTKVSGIEKQRIDSLRQNLMVKNDLNTATAQDLAKVPGINQTLAQNIIRYREANGPFSSVDDLNKVSGINDFKLDMIKNYIQVGTGG